MKRLLDYVILLEEKRNETNLQIKEVCNYESGTKLTRYESTIASSNSKFPALSIEVTELMPILWL